MKTIANSKAKLLSNKKISDFVFILWAGGAALLSYSLVYALRKPFTAAFALPLLALLGYILNRLPQPTTEDIAAKSQRVTLNSKQRKELFYNFMPVLILLFVANLMLVILRDIKEDFLVKISGGGYSNHELCFAEL